MNYKVEPTSRSIKGTSKSLFAIRDETGKEILLANRDMCDRVVRLLQRAYEAGRASHSKAIVNSWSKRNAAVRISM